MELGDGSLVWDNDGWDEWNARPSLCETIKKAEKRVLWRKTSVRDAWVSLILHQTRHPTLTSVVCRVFRFPVPSGGHTSFSLALPTNGQ
jgi:hypothetical protein